MESTFVAYYRVSTTKQGHSGLGLEAQQQAVANFVRCRDCIVAEFTEVETGTGKRARPQLALAIAEAKRTGSQLVVAKLDRLARNLHFITTLQQANVDFVAADMPNANSLTVHIYAAMAEHEARLISERTKAALSSRVRRFLVERGEDPDAYFSASNEQQRATRARYGAEWPLGTAANFSDTTRRQGAAAMRAKAQKNERNQRAAAFAALLHQQGHTLRQIAETLNSQGFTTSRNNLFQATTVQRLLR